MRSRIGGNQLRDKGYNHAASRIAGEDYEEYAARVRLLGLEVGEGRSRVKGEGKSLYFYDYDKHLFELHTGTLEERLTRYNQA